MIRELTDDIRKDILSGPFAGPLITLGLNELQKRAANKSYTETRRITKVAIAVATASLLASAFFGLLNWQGDRSWQRDQLKTPTTIQQQLSQNASADRKAIHDLDRTLARFTGKPIR